MRSPCRYAWLPLAVVLVAGSARAQHFRLHGTGAVAHAVGGHQQRELGWGGTGRIGAEWVVMRQLGVTLQGSGLWLGAGKLPRDRSLQPLDAASSYGTTAGLHLRPLARRLPNGSDDPGGPWVGSSGGVAFTGGLRRAMMDAGAGYDFFFEQSRLGLGPMLGWEHVFQPNRALRPADANILFFGVHGFVDVGGTSAPVDGDRDGDKIRDSVDQCPDQPEDYDGFEDQDGCPDLDNDQDGIPDKSDQCPDEAEDKDGFKDQDGCPEFDNDHDGIVDSKDKCPLAPEDKDGFEDEDGCPDPDNDKDGVPDGDDLCPDEAETLNGYADSDGCPDAEQIRVVGDKIVLDDRVHFMVNSSIIRRVSDPLLQRLAKLIKEHPEYVHIEVQGHTDERGPDWFNERLSQRRADAVLEFLVRHGIDRARLSSKGFGSSRPLVDKSSEYAWYMNRRVEFEITREIKAPAGQKAALPPLETQGAEPAPDDSQPEVVPSPPPVPSTGENSLPTKEEP